MRRLPEGISFIPASRQDRLQVIVLRVQLYIDGREIPLNDFVERMLGSTVAGAASSLRGVDDNWKSLEIRIQR